MVHRARLEAASATSGRIEEHKGIGEQDWTADVAEPKVKLRGRFCPISEVCQEVANLSDPLPETILSILYKDTQAGDDMRELKMDETYRGGSLVNLRQSILDP